MNIALTRKRKFFVKLSYVFTINHFSASIDGNYWSAADFPICFTAGKVKVIPVTASNSKNVRKQMSRKIAET